LFAQQNQQSSLATVSQENLQISYNYTPGSFNAQGWLNWFELHARSNLIIPSTGRLLFRDWNGVGNNICEYIITNPNNTTQLWELTDHFYQLNTHEIF